MICQAVQAFLRIEGRREEVVWRRFFRRGRGGFCVAAVQKLQKNF